MLPKLRWSANTGSVRHLRCFHVSLGPDLALVKPDASPEEVKAVVNDEGSGQIFQQAVSLAEWTRFYACLFGCSL